MFQVENLGLAFLLTESSCLGRIVTNYEFQDNNCLADRRRDDSHRRHRYGDRCLHWHRNHQLPVVAEGAYFLGLGAR